MNESIRRAIKKLTANRKQFGFMVALLVVAGFMWGKLLFKDAPRAASANPSTAAKAAEDQGAAGSPLLARMPVVEVELPDQSRRDLFAMDLKAYVQIEPKKVIPAPNSVPEKSDEARRGELLAKLATLKLQTTILGETPSALVNGRLFQVGSEPLPGFTITRITEHSVWLRPADMDDDIELRMYRK